MYTRSLTPPKHSFFLFGPRATGKSTWLRRHYAEALWFNLLLNEEYLELLQDKGSFRRRVEGSEAKWVVIDEIQRLPELLNEVQDLIARYQDRFLFALSGSSARKLKREGVNLLAGRAITRNLFPLTSKELGFEFDIEQAIIYGMLPDIHMKSDIAQDILKSYVGTYLREEVQQEALTRNLDSFQRFLSVAAHMNGEIINVQGLSRDAAVARTTCQNYFEILVDTLIGFMLPAWKPKAKVRERGKPKFYFFDPGVVNGIANDFSLIERGEATKGKLLETFLLHELRSASAYLELDLDLSYWQGRDNREVDFIVKYQGKTIGIEVKASRKWRRDFGKNLLELPLDQRYVVYLGETLQKDGDITTIPIMGFLEWVYSGRVFGNSLKE